MKYLKQATKTKTGFTATFTSGAVTTSHDTACFFLIMQDKGTRPADIERHICIGEMTGGGHDWSEIRRIAKTFTAEQEDAA